MSGAATRVSFSCDSLALTKFVVVGLSEEMADDGYTHIKNIDLSMTVIKSQ